MTISTPEVRLAQRFHEAYERLAPDFDYKTRKASAVPWDDVPQANKALMIAVAHEILGPACPVTPSRPVENEDWGQMAQRAAEEHLDACNEWMYYLDNGEEGERPAGEDPSFGPYDGCDACIVREVLWATTRVIEEALRADILLELSSGKSLTDVEGARGDS